MTTRLNVHKRQGRTTEEFELPKARRLMLKEYSSIYKKDIEGFVIANRINPAQIKAIIYADGEWVLWYWRLQ